MTNNTNQILQDTSRLTSRHHDDAPPTIFKIDKEASQQGALPNQRVEAPVIEMAHVKRADMFYDALKEDETIARHGKFHLGPKTCWWAISKLGFGSTIVMDSAEQLEISRLTHVEFSRVQENERVMHRLIIGRFIAYIR